MLALLESKYPGDEALVEKFRMLCHKKRGTNPLARKAAGSSKRTGTPSNGRGAKASGGGTTDYVSGEKRMALVPSEPDSVYASSGWSSWDDFLNGPVDPDMPPPKARNPAAPQPPRTPTKISMCASDGEGEADAAVDDGDAPPFGGVPIFEIALVLAAAYAFATGEMS